MAFDLDEKFLKSAEEKLGCCFPDSFRQAMKENNGGAVIIGDETWHLHPIFDDSDRKRISRTCNDITRETAQMQSWEGWPEHAIAIGNNGYGDAIVLLCKSAQCNSHVYAWSHETAVLELLASDFSELERVE
jgi:hypothetical protein